MEEWILGKRPSSTTVFLHSSIIGRIMKVLLQLASNIPAALVGGSVFVVVFLVLHLGVLPAVGLSLIAYVVTGLLIFPAKSALEQREQETLKEVVREAERKLSTLRDLRRQIKNAAVQRQLTTICTIGDNILTAVKKNPAAAVSAKQFSGYYLDSTITIVQRYRDLTAHTTYSDDAQERVANVERMLTQIEQTFEQQLSHILREKMLDLDTELAVLQETIDIDTL